MVEVNKVMLNIRSFGAEVREIIGDANKSKEWLKNFHDCLLYGIEGISPFGDALLKEAMEYTLKAKETKRNAAMVRWHPTHPSQPTKQNKPPTKEEVYAFAEEHQLDDIIAREWLELHQERGFKDKNGNAVHNWKGALTRYCKAREDKL